MHKVLSEHEEELRKLSTALYLYDYLDKEEIEKVVKGKQLEKAKVREWEKEFVF